MLISYNPSLPCHISTREYVLGCYLGLFPGNESWTHKAVPVRKRRQKGVKILRAVGVVARFCRY